MKMPLKTSENNSLKEIAEELKKHKKILILSHQSPDGDTLGSAFALCYGLKQMGKEATVLCDDECPKKFLYLAEDTLPNVQIFAHDLVICVDIADAQLMGEKLSPYHDFVDICVDHHRTNSINAKLKYVDENAAATCEIIYLLLIEMQVKITKQMANCIYTGICTDTGCFEFSNTTAQTHRIAADLIDANAEFARINKELFGTKSKGRILIERSVLETMEFYCDDKVALCIISQELLMSTQMDSSELDGVASIPRQIEGVEVGITMKERVEGGYKISMRTKQDVDAAKICAALGGGGHARAAGCMINERLETAKRLLLEEVFKTF